MSYTRLYPVSWEQFHRDAKALSWRLADVREFAGIVAITRGGLVPAAIVARELDLRLIDTICVRSYRDTSRDAPEMIKPLESDDESWLIVDDLVDTGGTAQVVRRMLPNAHYATVYAKPAGRPLVDTFITEVSQDTWILFPWDTELQSVPPIVDSATRE